MKGRLMGGYYVARILRWLGGRVIAGQRGRAVYMPKRSFNIHG